MGSELPLDIDVQDAQKLLTSQAEVVLLDCRTEAEYQIAAISGSVLIPMDELQQRLPELAEHQQKNIIVHCHLGGRSQIVAEWLRAGGFPKAQNMAGGIEAWSLEIDPSVPRYS